MHHRHLFLLALAFAAFASATRSVRTPPVLPWHVDNHRPAAIFNSGGAPSGAHPSTSAHAHDPPDGHAPCAHEQERSSGSRWRTAPFNFLRSLVDRVNAATATRVPLGSARQNDLCRTAVAEAMERIRKVEQESQKKLLDIPETSRTSLWRLYLEQADEECKELLAREGSVADVRRFCQGSAGPLAEAAEDIQHSYDLCAKSLASVDEQDNKGSTNFYNYDRDRVNRYKPLAEDNYSPDTEDHDTITGNALNSLPSEHLADIDSSSGEQRHEDGLRVKGLASVLHPDGHDSRKFVVFQQYSQPAAQVASPTTISDGAQPVVGVATPVVTSGKAPIEICISALQELRTTAISQEQKALAKAKNAVLESQDQVNRFMVEYIMDDCEALLHYRDMPTIVQACTVAASTIPSFVDEFKGSLLDIERVREECKKKKFEDVAERFPLTVAPGRTLAFKRNIDFTVTAPEIADENALISARTPAIGSPAPATVVGHRNASASARTTAIGLSAPKSSPQAFGVSAPAELADKVTSAAGGLSGAKSLFRNSGFPPSSGLSEAIAPPARCASAAMSFVRNPGAPIISTKSADNIIPTSAALSRGSGVPASAESAETVVPSTRRDSPTISFLRSSNARIAPTEIASKVDTPENGFPATKTFPRSSGAPASALLAETIPAPARRLSPDMPFAHGANIPAASVDSLVKAAGLVGDAEVPQTVHANFLNEFAIDAMEPREKSTADIGDHGPKLTPPDPMESYVLNEPSSSAAIVPLATVSTALTAVLCIAAAVS